MGRTRPPVRTEVLPPPPTTAPAGELLGDPLREVGLYPATDHPAGIAPPPGSKIGLARQVRQGEWVRVDTDYDCPGTVEDVARYYSDRAVRKGFRPVSKTEDSIGWRRVLFSKRQMTLIVALRKRSGEDKIVKVIVTSIFPAR